MSEGIRLTPEGIKEAEAKFDLIPIKYWGEALAKTQRRKQAIADAATAKAVREIDKVIQMPPERIRFILPNGFIYASDWRRIKKEAGVE